ncbi:MAG: ATPase, T2SS/T4P/T4SS family [Planctomycetota bacterium]|jgi:pilus assembly protein CpaF
MPHLMYTDERGAAQQVPIARQVFTIGKRNGNDLVLERTNISRQHARIFYRNGTFFIQDLGSRNGTYLNGSRVVAEMRVEHGSRIRLADMELVFVDETAPGKEAPPAARPAASPDPPGSNAPLAPAVAPPVVAERPGKVPGPLKKKIHIQLVKDMDLKHIDFSKHTEEEIRRRAIEASWMIVREINQEIPNWISREKLVKEVVDEALGLGPLEDLLADPEVDEIMVNRANQIFVERRGKLELSDLEFMDNNQVLSVIRRILAPIGRRIDESSPMVDARLKDGSRVNAIIHPLSLTGPTVTIRKFAKTPFTVDDLIAFGTLTRNMGRFMKLAVENRMNACISGGTGSGKTTTLNVLSAFIPQDERIVTIEDAAELKLPQVHVVSLEAKPPNIEGKGSIPIRKLVINSLRMRPDRIIVGECRGGEALDMLQAMNTGHDGSLTTLHANSPRDALNRLETMVLMAGMELPSKAIRDQIASAIQLIIHEARLPDGKRKITQVTEITGMEGNVITMQDIFKFQQTGYGPQGEVMGNYLATGAIPKFVHDLRARGIDVDMNIFR